MTTDAKIQAIHRMLTALGWRHGCLRVRPDAWSKSFWDTSIVTCDGHEILGTERPTKSRAVSYVYKKLRKAAMALLSDEYDFEK